MTRNILGFCGQLRKDAKLVVVAVLLAITLWVYFTVSQSNVAYFPGALPLRERNVPEGMVAFYTQQRVKVKLQAPSDVWRNLKADSLSAYLDLAGLDEGVHMVKVKVGAKHNGVTVVEKDPDEVAVRIEAVIERKIPVKVVFQGKAKEELVPARTTVQPSEVAVSGARSLVEKIPEVEARVQLAGEKRNFQQEAVVFLPGAADKSQGNISLSPSKVTVAVSLLPASGTKTVGVKAEISGRPDPSYYLESVEVDPATVEVFSGSGALPSISTVKTEKIDIEGLSESSEREVALIALLGITLEEKKAKVKITLAPNIIEREIVPVCRYEVDSGIRVVSAEPFKAVVAGPIAVVRHLSPDEVEADFDLKGKEAGTYLVDIDKESFSLPEGCTLVSCLPSAVKIALEKVDEVPQ